MTATAVAVALHIFVAVVWVGGMFTIYVCLRPALDGRKPSRLGEPLQLGWRFQHQEGGCYRGRDDTGLVIGLTPAPVQVPGVAWLPPLPDAADEIITALSRCNSLFVIARNSSFTYKGKVADVRWIGHELGVRFRRDPQFDSLYWEGAPGRPVRGAIGPPGSVLPSVFDSLLRRRLHRLHAL